MNIKTHYSILQALNSPEEMIKACKEKGYTQLALCDISSMSGTVEFFTCCKKENIKPILGICLKICELDRSIKEDFNKQYDCYIIAKNLTGYKNLLKITTKSNKIDGIYSNDYQTIPRLNLKDLIGLTDGLIAILADNSELSVSENEGKDFVLTKYKKVFPEVYSNNEVYWPDVRYINKESNEDWRVLLCILCRCTLSNLKEKIAINFPHLLSLLDKDNSIETYESYTSQPLFQQTKAILDSCEEYEILSKPKPPTFVCPDGLSQPEYLTNLCRIGWMKRFPSFKDENLKKLYVDRVKMELSVLQGCELDGYFLVVQDYINWAKNQGWLVGCARGSSGGSLVAYLLGITEIDPIPHDLMFERFYSPDRSAGGTISLPDIDTDFPKDKRKLVIDYIKEKYGKNRVVHIPTFGTLKGSGALTGVLKAHEVMEDSRIKNITKNIPQQDKVIDRMTAEDEPSLIRYTLKNLPKILEDLGRIEGDEIVGDNAYYLKQAIRLEGRIRNIGVHASGILIFDDDIETVAPLIADSKCEQLICAYDMGPSELVGLVKVDILSIDALDKLMEINYLLMGISENQ